MRSIEKVRLPLSDTEMQPPPFRAFEAQLAAVWWEDEVKANTADNLPYCALHIVSFRFAKFQSL